MTKKPSFYFQSTNYDVISNFEKKILQAKLKKKLRNFLVKVVTISSLCSVGWGTTVPSNLIKGFVQRN